RAAQVGREGWGRAAGQQPGDEGVGAPRVVALVWERALRGEVGGGRVAGHPGGVPGVHADAAAVVVARAAQVGRVRQGAVARYGRDEQTQEGVLAALVGTFVGVPRDREVGRGGVAGDVRRAGRAYCHGKAVVVLQAAQVRRVGQGRAARRVEFRKE